MERKENGLGNLILELFDYQLNLLSSDVLFAINIIGVVRPRILIILTISGTAVVIDLKLSLSYLSGSDCVLFSHNGP